MKSLLSRWTYPAVMGLGIGLHYVIQALGAGVQAAAYVPVLLGAAVITFMELKFPHRRQWTAARQEVANDVVFMLGVQVVLPKLLAFAAAVTLLDQFNHSGWTFGGAWPHGWPVFAQAFLMLAAADFLRYWLHKFSHEWTPLWRLHAVHHSPHKLYWFNVGRFHPIEKALQFVFDTLPFLVLGISEQVLAFYFVFYSLNGFFQHCNIELKLGFLNYIVSGPELHRWHHSKIEKESNQNYGNNLIVWDLIFGTRFLPGDRKVATLGLKNRAYPMSFLQQMRTPFLKGIDRG